ncbi:DUF2703 domain-containing protein [Pseudonocardia tropica]|uniref:DUF2703 domain-containing protein n=1 Tax=Pseudonocardia tropica TaxID=681289 RepID=A0ABV1K1Z3_9PSEU
MTTTTEPTEVLLEVLYLDARTCSPCRATLGAVDEAAAELGRHLEETGRRLTVRTIHVTDPQQAEELGFVSSPTVRVDGTDIELDLREQPCGTCSALAGEQVECRTFAWRGERHPSPPAEMIVSRILDHLDGTLPAATGPRASGASSVGRFLTARAVP